MPERIRAVQQDFLELARDCPEHRDFDITGWASEQESLVAALEQVQSRPGAGTPGPDGTRPSAIGAERSFLAKVQQRLSAPVFVHGPTRLVEVPKPWGGTRTLTIQNADDRVADTAVNIFFRPVVDAGLPDCSFGFREGRGTLQALLALGEVVRTCPATSTLVGLDLAGCFNSVSWPHLERSLRRRINEPRLVDYVRGLCAKAGIPEGSPMSPAVADLHLQPLVWQVQRHGLGITYGDDFVLACASRAEARSLIASLTRTAGSLGVAFAPHKTHFSTLTQGVGFVGYELARRGGVVVARAGSRAVPGLTASLERVEREHQHGNPSNFIRKVNEVLRGWAEYFRFDAKALAIGGQVAHEAALRWLNRRLPQRLVQKYYDRPDGIAAGDALLLDPRRFYSDFPAALRSRSTGPTGLLPGHYGSYLTTGHRGGCTSGPALPSCSPGAWRRHGVGLLGGGIEKAEAGE